MIFLSIFSTLHFHNRTIRASLRIDPPQDPPSPIHPFKFRAFSLRVPAIHGIKDRGEITQISFQFFACLNGPSRNRNVEISMAEPSLPRVYPEPWATCVRGAHDFTYKCSYICIPSACI